MISGYVKCPSPLGSDIFYIYFKVIFPSRIMHMVRLQRTDIAREILCLRKELDLEIEFWTNYLVAVLGVIYGAN